MRKNDFEKEIEKRTPIDLKFSDIENSIDYSKYEKPVAAPRKRFNWYWIPPVACGACALCLAVPIILNNMKVGTNSGINSEGSSAPSDVEFDPNFIKYNSNGLNILNLNSIGYVYYENQQIDNNFVVSKTLTNGSEKILSSSEYGVNISPNVNGDKILEIYEKENVNINVSYTITIIPESVSKIDCGNSKKIYYVGETFNPTDVVVVKGDRPGIAKANEFEYDISKVDFDTVGTYTIDITLKTTLYTVKDSYQIEVREIDDIKLDGDYALKDVDSNGGEILTSKVVVKNNSINGEKISLSVPNKGEYDNKYYYNVKDGYIYQNSVDGNKYYKLNEFAKEHSVYDEKTGAKEEFAFFTNDEFIHREEMKYLFNKYKSVKYTNPTVLKDITYGTLINTINNFYVEAK